MISICSFACYQSARRYQSATHSILISCGGESTHGQRTSCPGPLASPVAENVEPPPWCLVAPCIARLPLGILGHLPRPGQPAEPPGCEAIQFRHRHHRRREPVASYWNPTVIVSDNRIPAFGVDTSVYEFAAPPAGTVNVEATLIFRRAFWELMQAKRWEDTPDIVMEQETVASNQ